MTFLLAFFAVFTVRGSGKVSPSFEFSKAGYWEVEGSPRKVTSINQGWEFSLDAFETTKRVSLPHSIDEGEIGFEASGGVNRQQPAWYRRKFVWEGESAHQFLHFEAIMGKCRIKLNGRLVTEHFGGFLPIHAEVTDVLRRGENLLEVWCDNSDDPSYPPGKPQQELDFAYFGGIYRDAYMIETGTAYVTDSDRGGVYVTSHLEEDGSWTVRADVTLGGDTADAETELLYDGLPVSSSFKPKDPMLWSPEQPNLHFLTVKVRQNGALVDSVGVRFGIRDFVLNGDGLSLNGKPYNRKLIGVNRHQDFLFIGMALSNSLHWRDVKKYRDCGMSVIRNAHYPQDPAFMDACDALGMFVIVNTPGWQFWNEKDPLFERRVYDDIKKMVRRDRSRASILMWEPVLNETRFPASFVTNAVAMVKRETRCPNYCVCDRISAGSGVCDVTYGDQLDPSKATFCREWGDFPDDWNAQNSSSRIPMEWGESPMVNQAWHYMHEIRWPSLDSELAQPRHHFGGALWHGADHARGYHPDNFFGGILTYGRQKKYSWHAFKAALTTDPYVYVAHELSPASPSQVPVFSNCTYTATLLGEPFNPERSRFAYEKLQRLTYECDSPEVKARAKMTLVLPDGSMVEKLPAKRFARIDLTLDTEGLAPVADGSDLVACTATLADKVGTPRRYASEVVRFSVDGPAEIVGENPQRTRWGEAIVLLRMKERVTPEKITVRAELMRKGGRVRQNGAMTFVPGSDRTAATFQVDTDDAALSAIEKQQRDFNFDDGDFQNPVIPCDWPDPAFWRANGKFYSVATGLRTIRSSANGIDWSDTGIDPLAPLTRAKLVSITSDIWAPCVVRIKEKWMLYVSLFRGVADCRIVALVSDSPTGPFEYAAEVLNGQDLGILNVIDPYVQETDGKIWIFFGSCQDGIHRLELTDNGLAVKSGSLPVHVAGLRSRLDAKGCRVNNWGRPGAWEGSFLLKRNNWWYLFLSGGLYCDHTYHLVVGRSRTIDGVFLDRDGAPLTEAMARPILSSDKGDAFYGPGHNGEVLVSDDGRDHMFYHCHDADRSKNDRPTFLQELKWDSEGWPYFEKGKPLPQGRRFRAVKLSNER